MALVVKLNYYLVQYSCACRSLRIRIYKNPLLLFTYAFYRLSQAQRVTLKDLITNGQHTLALYHVRRTTQYTSDIYWLRRFI